MVINHLHPSWDPILQVDFLKLFSLTSLLPQGLQARCEDGSGAIHWFSPVYPGFRPQNKTGDMFSRKFPGKGEKNEAVFWDLPEKLVVGCWSVWPQKVDFLVVFQTTFAATAEVLILELFICSLFLLDLFPTVISLGLDKTLLWQWEIQIITYHHLTHPKPNFLTFGQYIKWFSKKV